MVSPALRHAACVLCMHDVYTVSSILDECLYHRRGCPRFTSGSFFRIRFGLAPPLAPLYMSHPHPARVGVSRFEACLALWSVTRSVYIASGVNVGFVGRVFGFSIFVYVSSHFPNRSGPRYCGSTPITGPP